ncbi:MAG: RNA polymerase sigma factor [Haliscomenobacter sp.]|nr:RNA polymerase sigma factor [Haliscomenobacter sp.]
MPETAISDEQILGLMQHQQTREKGFRLLLGKYQERLYWQIRRMVLNHEDTNDVLQNCMVKVFRSIDQFEGKSALYTWLFRIAANESITFLNQRQKRGSTSLDEEGAPVANGLKADPYFDGDKLQAALHQVLHSLPDKQRQVFNLRYFEEMSYHDMAAVLNTSEGALKASFHHAVKKIEHYFRERGLE